MSDDPPKHQLHTATDGRPTREPMEVVVARSADGELGLGVREPAFERQYSIADPYLWTLFVAICQHAGAKVYRRKRQRSSTICVMTPLALHDAIWEQFQRQASNLEDKLKMLTQEFVNREVCSRSQGSSR